MGVQDGEVKDQQDETIFAAVVGEGKRAKSGVVPGVRLC